jgi:hypothetical protein
MSDDRAVEPPGPQPDPRLPPYQTQAGPDQPPTNTQARYGGYIEPPGVLPIARRQNPDEMFTPAQNFARNQQWARPGPYQTQLTPAEEQQFQNWLRQNNIDLSRHEPAYDMRGFWKGIQAGDPRAKSALNPDDIDPRTLQPRLHWPDAWKTPYEATFSDESMYARPGAGTPQWQKIGNRYWVYQLPGGHVIFDAHEGRWYGMPGYANPPGSERAANQPNLQRSER